MIQGRTKFDGIALMEGNFSFLGSTVHLEGKGAFINSRTSDTHGWTHNKNWSPDVIKKLGELRLLMEIDLGRMHLVEGGERVTTTAGTHADVEAAEPGGLGEMLRGAGVPSV